MQDYQKAAYIPVHLDSLLTMGSVSGYNVKILVLGNVRGTIKK